MKKIATIIAILHCSLLFSQNATTPKCIVEDLRDSILVTYIFDSPSIVQSPFLDGTYHLNYKGFGVNRTNGEPATLFKNDIFEIPLDSEPEVTLLRSEYTDRILQLSPAIPDISENQTYFTHKSVNYNDFFFPKDIIKTQGTEEFRGHKLLHLTINPIQYNSSSNTLRSYSLLQYKIRLTHSEEKQTRINSQVKEKLPYKTLNRLSREQSSNIQNPSLTQTPINRNYLIITIDEYQNVINNFVEWKRTKGFNVFIEKRPRGEWNYTTVKSVIESYYNAHDIEYLLIIGGALDVPSKYFLDAEDHIVATDYPYGLPPSEGSLPQIKHGRIPTRTAQEVSIVLNKITNYERAPTSADSFYNTAAIFSYFQDEGALKDGKEDRDFILFSETIKEHIQEQGKTVKREYYAPDTINPIRLNNGETLPSSLQRPNYAWDGCAYYINRCINNGTFLAIHRDHGGKCVWRDPYYTLTSVNALSNENLLPVIFNIDCSVGEYFTTDTCLAEKFLIKENGGCVGSIAASGCVFTQINSLFGLGLIDAIWPNIETNGNFNEFSSLSNDSIFDLGGIMNYGFATIANTTQSLYRENIMNAYHCFGDPSMMIYTQRPNEFSNVQIHIVNDSIQIIPNVSDCIITGYNKYTGATCCYKTNERGLRMPIERGLSICIDKHNYIPFVWNSDKDLYIQNKIIRDEQRELWAGTIKIGNAVTSEEPVGNVQIIDSDIIMTGTRLEIHPEASIVRSNFKFIAK